MNTLNIFKAKLNNVFGMIHVKPLPGKYKTMNKKQTKMFFAFSKIKFRCTLI